MKLRSRNFGLARKIGMAVAIAAATAVVAYTWMGAETVYAGLRWTGID